MDDVQERFDPHAFVEQHRKDFTDAEVETIKRWLEMRRSETEQSWQQKAHDNASGYRASYFERPDPFTRMWQEYRDDPFTP